MLFHWFSLLFQCIFDFTAGGVRFPSSCTEMAQEQSDASYESTLTEKIRSARVRSARFGSVCHDWMPCHDLTTCHFEGGFVSRGFGVHWFGSEGAISKHVASNGFHRVVPSMTQHFNSSGACNGMKLLQTRLNASERGREVLLIMYNIQYIYI